MKGEIMKIIQFGGTKEEQKYLAKLVVSGEKIATSSLVVFQEMNQTKETIVGERWSIQDGENKEYCQVVVTEVYQKPFGEIDETFACDEGDGSFENWYDIHFNYYECLLKKVGLTLTKETLLECVYFEKITKR